ncbi:MAG: hypothetical protein KJ548_15050 [Actinobacteria bacterium]|nr:hypothetical protein [Actinomycetota bacterium]
MSEREVGGAQPFRETEETEPVPEGAGRQTSGKKEFSWLNAITAGSQLTLDIIRVIREATDLYRKLFPGKGGLAG